MWQRLTDPEVAARLDRLDIPFNRYGLDPFGISRDHLGAFYSMLGFFYRRYFRCLSFGIEQIPAEGPVMLVGNHSGGLPVDGGMVIASLFYDLEPPRHTHGMVEKFAQHWPVVSPVFSRVGQLTGLPEHAVRLLQSGRVLMVFPEGARGTGKLYKDKYQLVRFGTGFVRLALRTGTPIVPLAFIGGEEAIPTIFHAQRLAKWIGAPYVPITPYLLPLPLPVQCSLHYGAPMRFEGDGSEPDHVIDAYVAQVRDRITALIEEGRVARRTRLGGPA
ncbi:MAG: lysophospholipid acyltransferase family protein [bacterium]